MRRTASYKLKDSERGYVKARLENLRNERELLDALHDCRLDDFQRALPETFQKKNYQLIWDMIRIISEGRNPEFLKALIENGFEVNNIDPVCGKAAIHYVVEKGNLAALKILLDNQADPNLQNEHGETAVHLILKSFRSENDKEDFLGCFKYLLDVDSINLNIPDDEGIVPIQYALSNQTKKNMKLYVDYFFSHYQKINWKWIKDEEEITQNRIRKQMSKRVMPATMAVTSETDGSDVSTHEMFYWIKNGYETKFCENLTSQVKSQNPEELVNCNNGFYTYLQYACKNGMARAVKLLLNCKADVNLSPKNSEKPVELACMNGRYEVLRILLEQSEVNVTPSDTFNTTLLHRTVQTSDESNGFFKCLELLLKTDLKVDEKDGYDRTPLHYAVINNLEKSVAALLDEGADFDAFDAYKQTPLANMTHAMMERYLDSKIRCNNKPPRDKDYALILDYQNVIKGQLSEKKWTLFLNNIIHQKALKSLIIHPIFSTIIYFKWSQIKWLFYANLILYAVFCFCLTAYILTGEPFMPLSKVNTSTEISALRITLFVMMSILFILELLEFHATGFSYILSFDNLLRMFVLALSFIIVATDTAHDVDFRFGSEFCALAILFTWFELFLVLGKQPTLTFYVDMFRVASQTLFRFVFIHSFLIIAFGLSFHTLFRRNKESWFASPGTAIFKTIIMVTGEYNAEDIDFDAYSGVSHFLFVAFIFIISIVLINLLIGLAGSATKRIEDNKYLYKCIAQVTIIRHFENTLYFTIQKGIDRLLKLKFSKEIAENRKLFIYPNERNNRSIFNPFHLINKKGFYITGNHIHFFKNLDGEIVRSAQAVVEKNKEATKENERTIADLESKITDLEDKIIPLEEEFKQFKNRLNDLLSPMENKLPFGNVKFAR